MLARIYIKSFLGGLGKNLYIAGKYSDKMHGYCTDFMGNLSDDEKLMENFFVL